MKIEKVLKIFLISTLLLLLVFLLFKNFSSNSLNVYPELEQSCKHPPSQIYSNENFEGFAFKEVDFEVSIFPEIENLFCIGLVKEYSYSQSNDLINVVIYNSTKFRNLNTIIVYFVLLLLMFLIYRNNKSINLVNLGFLNLLLYAFLFSNLNTLNSVLELILTYILSATLIFYLEDDFYKNIKRTTYRKDINVFRAISVLIVIFYHFEVPYFNNGWIGVDIFFTISGFLISNILISSMNSMNFSFRSFYLRRVKRLFPVFLFILLLTTYPSYQLVSPELMIIYLNGLVSAILLFSNFYYLGLDFYTSPEASYFPLLHTWSLSIEEQFYLLVPFLIYVIYKLNKNRLIPIFVVIFLTSLFINFIPTSSKNIFYMLQFRIWEFLLGTLVMLIAFNKKITLKKYMYNILVFLLIILFFTISIGDIVDVYPKLIILGLISLILLSDIKNEKFISKLDNFRVINLIGLSSYSAYLIHQPIFSFFRIYKDSKFEEIFLYEKITLIIFVIILSFVLWRLIEIPFQKFVSNGITFSIISSIIIISLIFAYFGLNNDGYSNRYPELPAKVKNLIKAEGQKLIYDSNGKLCDGFDNFCKFENKGDKKMIVFGDSQSFLLSSFLYDEYKDDFTFIPLNGDRLFRCIFYKIDMVGDCNGDEEDLFNVFLEENTESVYIFFASFERFEEGWTKAGQNFTFYFDKIMSLNNDLVVISPTPYSFKNKDIKFLYEQRLFVYGDSIGYSFNEWKDNIDNINLFLEKQNPNLLIDPTIEFCQNIIPNTCMSAVGDEIFYYDRVHLSIDGTTRLANLVIKDLTQLSKELNFFE